VVGLAMEVFVCGGVWFEVSGSSWHPLSWLCLLLAITIFSKFGFGVGSGFLEWRCVRLVETFPASYRSWHFDIIWAFILKSESYNIYLKGLYKY